ncbi:MAG: hypothetical protein RIG62_02320 [Cyclobacteriaceae bacterium]
MKHLLIILLAIPGTISAQERPDIFFREDFKETPAEIPVSQEHIANEDVIISLYGPGASVIKKSHHDTPADDPYYLWSGLCEQNWAVTLKHKSGHVDLAHFGKIRWRAKQSGFHQLHILLKLADGTWLVSDVSDPPSTDWRISEFNISDIQWMGVDMALISATRPIENPDLSKVEEIGWTDFMRGGGSLASSRVDWIEVVGYPVN